MPDDQVRQYLLKRTYARQQVLRIETSLHRFNQDTSLEELQIRIESLEKSFSDFKDNDIRITMYPGNESELPEVEEKYITIKTKLRGAINLISKTGVETLYNKLNDSIQHYSESHKELMDQLNTGFAQRPAVVEVKLPALNIPKYDGKSYESFPGFRDAFEAAVHNRENLSASQKFQYLQGLLTGEAYDLIRHMRVTGDDYENAWDMVKRRFDKKRHMVTNYIRRFIDQPSVSSGNCKSLRQLANATDEIIRGLSAIGNEARNRDPWLIFMLVQKLDQESRQAWATTSSNWEYPSYDQFMTFLNSRCDAFETCEVMTNKKSGNRQMRSNTASSSSSVIKCPECQENHTLSSCTKYLSLSAIDRKSLVENKGLCFNCLNKTHRVTNCRLRYGCKKCNRRHHTTIHDACLVSNPTEPVINDGASTSGTVSSNTINCVSEQSVGGILPTIMAKIMCNNKSVGVCRILLDSGSSGSLISESCIQRSGLKRQRVDMTVTGVGGSTMQAKGETQITLQSLTEPKNQISITAVILTKLAKVTPQQISVQNLKILQNLKLADPSFEKCGLVDIILGMDVFFEILREGIVRNRDGVTIAQNTAFGYVVGGNSEFKRFKQNGGQHV